MCRRVAFTGPRRSSGVGLIEFLVALLLFTTGLAGLLSSQLAGQRATQAALQRTVALSLAEDLLARIEANPAALPDYTVMNLGAAIQDRPETDCRQSPCTPTELARHDLWQVAARLDASAGGTRTPRLARLTAARACVERSGEAVTVSLSWRVGTTDTAFAGARCAGGDPARREVALMAWMVAVS